MLVTRLLEVCQDSHNKYIRSLVHTPMVRDWPPRPGALRTHDSFVHKAISTGEAVCAVFISSQAFSDNNSTNICACNVECHAKAILYIDRLFYCTTSIHITYMYVLFTMVLRFVESRVHQYS